jgi:hypothetical protein
MHTTRYPLRRSGDRSLAVKTWCHNEAGLGTHTYTAMYAPPARKISRADAELNNRSNQKGKRFQGKRFLELVKKLVLPISALRIFNTLHG